MQFNINLNAWRSDNEIAVSSECWIFSDWNKLVPAGTRNQECRHKKFGRMAVSIVWAPQRTLDYLRPQPGTVPDTAILWFAATKCAQTVQPSGCLGLIDTRAGKALEVLGCSKQDEADPDTQKRQVSNQRANVWPTSWLVSPLGWQPRVCGHRSSILPVCPPFFSWVNVVGHSISESRLSSPWRLANNIQLFSLNAIEVEQVLAAFSLKTYRVFHPEATSPPQTI